MGHWSGKLIFKGAKSRSQRGQALVEGASMMVVMTTVVALLLFCLINTYILATYNLRLQSVAADGARRIAAYKWWLGMQRPDYNREQAQADTEKSINAELASMGLPQASNFTYKYSSELLRKKDTTIVRVDFDVQGLKIARGLFFPPFLKLHAAGVSSDAEHAVTRHGQATIHVEDPENSGLQRGVRVPVYNATLGESTAAHDRWLRAGDSAAGDYGVAYLRIKCRTTGSYINKQGEAKDANGRPIADITDQANWGLPPQF